MSTQPEAQWLADAMDSAIKQTDADDDVIHVARWFVEDAAAELRRLSAENERLAALVCDYAAEEAPDALRKVAADRDRWYTKAQQAEAQRDALRGELKEATKAINDPAVNNLRTLAESIRMLSNQRDALLEALHAMLSHTAMLDPSQGFDGFDHSAVNQARAAIKAVEEGENHAKSL